MNPTGENSATQSAEEATARVAAEFFTTLHGDTIDAERRLSIVWFPSKIARHRLFMSAAEAGDFVATLAAEHDVYHRVCLMAGDPSGRGDATCSVTLPCLWGDIDIHNADAHASNSLPPSLADALDLFDVIPVPPTFRTPDTAPSLGERFLTRDGQADAQVGAGVASGIGVQFTT